MKINNVSKLIVKYNNRIVGYLEETKDKRIAFQYSNDWIKTGFSLSPFSLPLKNDVFIAKGIYFNGLFGVFYDSLPDGWGELLFRRILFKNGIDIDKISNLTRLSLIGNKGLGALTYYPTQYDESEELDFDLDRLAQESQKIFNNLSSNDLDYIYLVGGSSGGARPKAHISINNEEWIVKFSCSYDPIEAGFEEYNMNLLAKKCSINVNEFKLFNSKLNKGYFGSKRFDRQNGKKIHMISLSSLLETTHKIPNLDYLHLFQVIKNICNKDDLYEAYRRMCFNVLIGNKDDHGKNFSFLYDEEDKIYKLSPFYDITQTPFKIEHEMTVNGNGKPDEKDLLEIAKVMDLDLQTCTNILENIKNKVSILIK